jgi:hypothetical protein
MAHIDPTISLGFTNQKFPAGVHVCQIISADDERQESLLKFLLAGLQAGERACCFSEQVNEAILKEFLANYGISLNDVIDSGAFMLSGTRYIYFHDNRFDPDRMLAMLKKYHEESESQGFTAARVIGEMLPEVQNLPGGHRLLEYESRVSQLLRKHPVTTVCQYDARLFDGATIMDILKVHPWMVVRGSVVHNPFHIPPEEYLNSINA